VFQGQIPLAIFFKCPRSIEELHLTSNDKSGSGALNLLDGDGPPGDPRQSPLPKLTHCPALRSITQGNEYDGYDDLTIFLAFVKKVPQDSPETIHLTQVNEYQWPLLGAFQRHSRTLTTIIFEWNQNLSSKKPSKGFSADVWF
jgi:hypothetical protein